MTMDERINRINELYHLSKTRELTEDEAAEQKELRKAYVESFRANLRGQLDNMDVLDANGNRVALADIRKNNLNKK